MTGIEGVLFDFGGTLADIYPDHDWLYAKACREFGVEAGAGRIGPAQELGWEPYATPDGPAHPAISTGPEVFARFKTDVIADRLRGMGVDGPVQAIASRILELDTQPEMYRPFDDALPVLEQLKERGYRMAIISNHEWHLPQLIEGLGLAPYFAAVVTSAQVGYRKPHPRIYQEALRCLKLAPERALMVGDSMSSDVAGAVRLGIPAVLLDRDGRHEDAVATPVIGSLTGLLDLL